MTISDFLLSIVASVIGAILLESRKAWRHIRFESFKIHVSLRRLTIKRLRVTASALTLIVTGLVFLSQSPRLASDDIVEKTTPEVHGLITPRAPLIIPRFDEPLTARGQMHPCVVDNSPCASAKRLKRAIFISSQDF
jgi:hypothetical protein